MEVKVLSQISYKKVYPRLVDVCVNFLTKIATLHVLKKHAVRRDCCHNDNYPFIVIDCVFMYAIYMPARSGNDSIWRLIIPLKIIMSSKGQIN